MLLLPTASKRNQLASCCCCQCLVSVCLFMCVCVRMSSNDRDQQFNISVLLLLLSVLIFRQWDEHAPIVSARTASVYLRVCEWVSAYTERCRLRLRKIDSSENISTGRDENRFVCPTVDWQWTVVLAEQLVVVVANWLSNGWKVIHHRVVRRPPYVVRSIDLSSVCSLFLCFDWNIN